jgi:DNA-binding MarR family transcriptional regulator
MPSPRAFYQVLRLYSAVSDRLETCLRAEGVTAAQYTVLSLLGGLEPTSSAELARRLTMTAQSMGQFVQGLEQKGLVERCVSPTHGRRIDIRRTAAGREVLDRCDALVDEAERAFFRPLSRAELAAFRDMATRLRIAQHELEAGGDKGAGHAAPLRRRSARR